MKKIFKVLANAFETVETGASRVASGLILLMMFLTTADVIGRYVFNSPLQGALEGSEILMVGVVFLGIAYVQRMKGHVSIEVATSWLPQRAQLGLEVFAYLISFVIMALITWHSGAFAWKAWITHDHTSGLIRIPLWPGKSLIPLGAGLLSIRLLFDIVSSFLQVLHGGTEKGAAIK